MYSDLKIEVLSKSDGFSVETENADESSDIAKNVRLLLFGRDQKTLTEGKSDANGSAFLPLPPDKF